MPVKVKSDKKGAMKSLAPLAVGITGNGDAIFWGLEKEIYPFDPIDRPETVYQ